jgi:ribose transport system permease protein
LNLRRIISSREFSVVVVIALICLAMAATKSAENFFGPANRINQMRNIALLGIFAIGETIVIISGGIDLSLGSLIAFTGMAMAMLLVTLGKTLVMPAAIVLAVVLTLLLALGIGVVHATLIHKVRLPAFVVTLASLLLLRSQALIMNKQLPVPLSDYPMIGTLANGNLFDGTPYAVPIPFLILVVVAVITAQLLNRARIGRYVYACGSNELATELSGVSTYKVKLFAYGASGLLGGLGGVLWAAYSGQGDPNIAKAYELDAVAAAVLGGASLNGGQGSVTGTLLGATLLYVIFSAINLSLDKPDLWRGTVVGGVLLLAVVVTAVQQRRTASRH